MKTTKHNSSSSRSNAALDSQTASTPTPEEIVAQLRVIGKSIPDVAPLTQEQKKGMRPNLYVPEDILHAQINLLGASGFVESAVGQPADALRDMATDSIRWDIVEEELKALLAGVAGGNLIRRQKLGFAAAQAYRVGTSLAKDPAHVELVPHVQEVRRLKRIASRKKAAPAGDSSPKQQGGSTT